MKAKIILVSIVLGVLIAFCLSGVASAADTGSVIPVVHVVAVYSGSLTIGGDVEDGVMDFGYLPAQGEPAIKTLTLNVTANANWQITVSKSQDLTIAGSDTHIPSENFTFTSSAGTPELPGPPTYYSDSEFGTDTPVITNGTAADSCQASVAYRLEIPADQPEGYYSAGNHVYTLIVGQ
ncbi:MAG: hypothetical protein WBC82_10945 [Dehalococcoidia bacterium]